MSQEINDDLHEDAWMNCMRKRLILGSNGPRHEDHLIYRVHSIMRSGYSYSFDPIATSIGPYHRGKKHLRDMEAHKERYFRDLLSRNRDVTFEHLVNMMKEREQRVRRCYPEKIKLKSNTFVEMMLLDGCFLVELLLKWESTWESVKHGDDDLFVGPHWRTGVLLIDLVLLENQLPFFLLQDIFEVVMPYEKDHLLLVKLSLKFLDCIEPFPSRTLNEKDEQVLPPQSVHHLLHLWHAHLIRIPPDSKILMKCNNLGPCLAMCNSWKDTTRNQQDIWMPGATQLEEAGINFKASSSNLLDIKFCNGEMTIPAIYVYEETGTYLRNLVAFEQRCLRSFHNYYFTSYVIFMDFLINTSKDVEILHKKGVLRHWMGEDEKVAEIFNNLNYGLYLGVEECYHFDTFKRVNEYTGRKKNKWRASLVRDYFYSPWASLSFIAAIVALSLSTIQTVFSVLSSNNNNPCQCQPK